MDHIEQGWTMVPNWVLMHPDLGRIDIAVYLVLAYHADNHTRVCHPSHKLIMAEARIKGERHLRTSLRRLSEVGAIKVVERPGYPNLYVLLRQPMQTPQSQASSEASSMGGGQDQATARTPEGRADAGVSQPVLNK